MDASPAMAAKSDYYANTRKSSFRPMLSTLIVWFFFLAGFEFLNFWIGGLGGIYWISIAIPLFFILCALFFTIYILHLSKKEQNGEIRKVCDVVLGVVLTVFGGMILNFFIGFLAIALMNDPTLKLIILIGPPLLALYLTQKIFKSVGRRYIAYGVLGSAIIPLLIFGACLGLNGIS